MSTNPYRETPQAPPPADPGPSLAEQEEALVALVLAIPLEAWKREGGSQRGRPGGTLTARRAPGDIEGKLVLMLEAEQRLRLQVGLGFLELGFWNRRKLKRIFKLIASRELVEDHTARLQKATDLARALVNGDRTST